MSSQKIDIPESFFFSSEQLTWLFLSKEVKPSPNHKMVKLLTFDNYYACFCHYDIVSNTRS